MIVKQKIYKRASNYYSRRLGHGDALQTATWGKGSQCTCDVKHVETVFDWAVEGHGGINVMVQEQRAKLVAAVHKAACDLFSRVPRQQDCSAGVKSVVARKLPRKGGASSRWYRGRAWTAARRGAVGVACAANSRIPPGHRRCQDCMRCAAVCTPPAARRSWYHGHRRRGA